MKNTTLRLILTLLLFSIYLNHALAATWPPQITTVQYRTSAPGNTMQPAYYYTPSATEPRPLLVGLHPWSSGYTNTSGAPYADWCIQKGWVFIHPNFRGPNNNPLATGSEYVVADIISAVSYAKGRDLVDESRIYLIGVSGGGHCSLLLAGRAPDIWAGVSAWVPIYNLVDWYNESVARGNKYAGMIADSVGGAPVAGSNAEAEALKRSSISYLSNATGFPVDINAGIHDGHSGNSVPISHTLHAFNQLARPADRLSDAQITYFVNNQAVPSGIEVPLPDPLYGSKTVLFRRSSNNARVTIFEGGHEIVYTAALTWLEQQVKVEPTPTSTPSPTTTPTPTPTPVPKGDWAKLFELGGLWHQQVSETEFDYHPDGFIDDADVLQLILQWHKDSS
jgi:dienelactone hydrolase